MSGCQVQTYHRLDPSWPPILFLFHTTCFNTNAFYVFPSALALQCKCIDDRPCRAVFTGISACIDCPANSNSMPGNSLKSSCMCNRGYSGAATSNDGCISCVAGKYKPTVGANSCTQCSTGTYSPTTSATVVNTCVTCRNFSTSPVASNSPALCICNAGYTNPITGAANDACSACVFGYKKLRGGDACDLCVQGKYGINTAATTSGAHSRSVLNTMNAHVACAFVYILLYSCKHHHIALCLQRYINGRITSLFSLSPSLFVFSVFDDIGLMLSHSLSLPHLPPPLSCWRPLSDSCLSCDLGTTSVETNRNGKASCVCDKGWTFDLTEAVPPVCIRCESGTFKNITNPALCTDCPTSAYLYRCMHVYVSFRVKHGHLCIFVCMARSYCAS